MHVPSDTPKLAVLIPMFNEEKVAERCIDAVMKVLTTLHAPIILLVVNDGSADATGDILEKKSKVYKSNFFVKTHSKNKGYGAALQTGMKEARKLNCEWVLHMDSDLTNDPKYIPQFLKYSTSNYDCIKASRYIPGSKVVNVPIYRQIVSVIGNSIAYLLFGVGVHDCTNGFRMVRLRKLDNVILKENNFSIILEELYYLKKRKTRFKEIPYTLTVRTDSRSHFTYKPIVFVDYFKYALRSAFL